MKLEINIIGGACFILRINNSCSIGCDPCLAPAGTRYDFRFFKSEKTKDPVYEERLLRDVDLWLLTHAHADHVDERGVAAISHDAEIVIESNVMRLLQKKNTDKVTCLGWRETSRYVFGSVRITVRAVAAYHGSNFLSRTFAGRVNGYLLYVEDKGIRKTIYITSDTVYNNRVFRSLKTDHVDLIIANLGEVMKNRFGGPLTMSVKMLSDFCARLNPSSVIPLHIDDFSHYRTTRNEVINSGFNIPGYGQWTDIS